MKTCKTGCGGKMKVGGTIKKMSKGGSTDLVGMPKYGNNPNTQEGRMLKKGGVIKKYPDGGATIPGLIKKDRTEIMRTPSGRAGVVTSLVGSVAAGVGMLLKKRKEKKAAKEAEKKKKETATPKGKFGMSVPVKHNPPKGMRHDSEHKGYESVAKAKKGGTLKTVPADKVGLAKLPTAVRNKMGFQKKGGSVKRK